MSGVNNIPKIVFLLPSCIDDMEYAERLIDSYKQHNVDNIKLFIVVPACDVDIFKQLCSNVKYSENDIKVVSEESLSGKYLVHDNSIHGIRPGYINQEIIKISFWEANLCDNYLCLDSDGVFIRDFYITDFMYNNSTPYTTLVEDHELIVEPEYYKKYWIGREKSIRLIQKEIGLDDRRMLTCHGFAILSCKVLKSLKEIFMIPRQMEYKDLLNKAPYEFSWYNMWLQKDETIPIIIKEPIFKYFHQRTHHLEYLRKNIKISDIARGYVGVVINSNYSRVYGMVSFEDGNIYPFRFYKKIIQFIKKHCNKYHAGHNTHDKNTIDWNVGDVVIHDADEKKALYLRKIMYKFMATGDFATKYINNVGTHKLYNDKKEVLHDPKRFGIEISTALNKVE